MKNFLYNLSSEGWARLVAASLTLCLCLLLLVGAIWAWRLPPAPSVYPEPNALIPQQLRVEERDFSAASLSIPELLVTEGTDEAGAEAPAMTFSLTERPLFWSSRRPHVGEQEVVSEPQGAGRRDNLDQVKLEGIYSAGESSGIVISIKKERSRIRLNETLFGWTLKELNENGAVFTRSDGKQRVLQLEHALPAKYTAASPSRTRSTPAAEPDSGQ
jgi:hypothetical protein